MASDLSSTRAAQTGEGFKTLKAGRPVEAIELFDAVIAQPDKPSTAEEAKALMYAVFGRGQALQRLALDGRGSWDEEVEARRDFLERYGLLRGPDSDELIAGVLFQLAQALARTGRTEESSAALDRLIEGFDDSTDESVKGLVLEARSLRAWDQRRARQRASDRRAVVVAVSACGGLALLSAVIASPSDTITQLRRVVALGGGVCLLGAQARAAWRIKRMRKRRGLTSAARIEYPPRHIAFTLVGVAIVAAECASLV
jgi:hypothetical protein